MPWLIAIGPVEINVIGTGQRQTALARSCANPPEPLIVPA